MKKLTKTLCHDLTLYHKACATGYAFSNPNHLYCNYPFDRLFALKPKNPV
jgi:hypothetical protein